MPEDRECRQAGKDDKVRVLNASVVPLLWSVYLRQ
jgi:hypothetical protein